MSTRQTVLIWAVSSVILTVGTLLSVTLAAVMLDAFAKRPGPVSITTLIPGSVYAIATVMKVCIVTGLVSAVIALVTPNLREQRVPVWGITSITLTPLTPLVGALVVLTVQTLADNPAGLSMSDFSQFSRTAVIVKLFLISAAAISAVISLVRHERPRLLSALGLVANALVIALFWHFEFYALGFDQDTWAPR